MILEIECDKYEFQMETEQGKVCTLPVKDLCKYQGKAIKIRDYTFYECKKDL